jgi:hypothetical protein
MNKDAMREDFEAWWQKQSPQLRAMVGSYHDCLLGWQAALRQQQAGKVPIGKVLVNPYGTCAFEKMKGVDLSYGVYEVFLASHHACKGE